ncbi:MAG: hypothetical protein ACK2T5_16210, partial [Anaerolineales bacterium]
MLENSQPASQPTPVLGDPLTDPVPGSASPESETKINRFQILWEQIVRAGLVEPVSRLATHAILIVMVLIVIWALRAMYFDPTGSGGNAGTFAAFAAPLPTPTPIMAAPVLPVYAFPETESLNGVPRLTDP